ncbi:hypothetical protein T484DRAFT_1816933 [Baffinella frigidus]|nr:hypothetical protein T484DRAFT_1816933 [Cryptophyta sp. CCMP2293]
MEVAREERLRQSTELDVATAALGETSLRAAALQKARPLLDMSDLDWTECALDEGEAAHARALLDAEAARAASAGALERSLETLRAEFAEANTAQLAATEQHLVAGAQVQKERDVAQASVAKMGAASALHLTRLTEATERVAALEHALAASESASETREREAGDYAAHLEGEMQAAEALTSELKAAFAAVDDARLKAEEERDLARAAEAELAEAAARQRETATRVMGESREERALASAALSAAESRGATTDARATAAEERVAALEHALAAGEAASEARGRDVEARAAGAAEQAVGEVEVLRAQLVEARQGLVEEGRARAECGVLQAEVAALGVELEMKEEEEGRARGEAEAMQAQVMSLDKEAEAHVSLAARLEEELALLQTQVAAVVGAREAAVEERDAALRSEAEMGETLRHREKTAADVLGDARVAREKVHPALRDPPPSKPNPET